MRLHFWKLSGAGNDFILVEGPLQRAGALARRLCDRRRAIGADGLLVVEKDGPRLSYFNADGSAAFCGNGSRCAALWLAKQGWATAREFDLTTSSGPLKARLLPHGRAAIAMPEPRLLLKPCEISAAGRRWRVSLWHTGVPHAVVRVPNVEKTPVLAAGRALRFHRVFGRLGANVDFVEPSPRGLLVRTYERGVEDETLACGTGLVACAAAAQAFGWSALPARLIARGGDTLRVFRAGGRTWLEGPAKIAFTGEIAL